MATKNKIWMTRDLKGEKDNIYVWNKKPTWDQESCMYNCDCESCDHDVVTCSSFITTLKPTCGDVYNVLKGFGIENNGILQRGQMIEFSTVTISQGITLAEAARDLAKRMKSKKKPTQKELVSFLDSISPEEESDDDDDDDDPDDLDNW